MTLKNNNNNNKKNKTMPRISQLQRYMLARQKNTKRRIALQNREKSKKFLHTSSSFRHRSNLTGTRTVSLPHSSSSSLTKTTKQKNNKWSVQNMTAQIKAQLQFYKQDLAYETQALNKFLRLQKKLKKLKIKLPGVNTTIQRHRNGIKKTNTDISNLKKRIAIRYKNGQINKINC